MTPDDCSIGFFCRVDERMGRQPKHPQARLHPSEIVTLGLLFALTGVGQAHSTAGCRPTRAVLATCLIRLRFLLGQQK
jgi:hypothetical protein